MSSSELSLAQTSLTWKDVLAYIDVYLAEMASMMNTQPDLGPAIQERMAVLMYKRMQVVEMANREKLPEGN